MKKSTDESTGPSDRGVLFDDHAAQPYLEELLSHAANGIQAALATKLSALDRSANVNVFSNARTFANEAAMISKLLWPDVRPGGGETKEVEKRRMRLGKMRGPALRSMLGVPEDSPLRDRRVRNAIEHFDERLDRRLSSPDRNLISYTIGPPNAIRIEGSDEPFYLHHYDPVTTEYTVLEASMNMNNVEGAMLELLNSVIRVRDEIEARRWGPGR